MTLGPPRDRGDALVVPFAWEATGLRTLFPLLEGDLELAPLGAESFRLTLSATYVPPLGELGARLDQALFHRVALSTVRSLLDRVASTLDGAVDEPAAGPSEQPIPASSSAPARGRTRAPLATRSSALSAAGGGVASASPSTGPAGGSTRVDAQIPDGTRREGSRPFVSGRGKRKIRSKLARRIGRFLGVSDLSTEVANLRQQRPDGRTRTDHPRHHPDRSRRISPSRPAAADCCRASPARRWGASATAGPGHRSRRPPTGGRTRPAPRRGRSTPATPRTTCGSSTCSMTPVRSRRRASSRTSSAPAPAPPRSGTPPAPGTGRSWIGPSPTISSRPSNGSVC